LLLKTGSVAVAVVRFRFEIFSREWRNPEGVAQAFWLATLKGDAAASWAMLSKVVQGNLKDESTWAKSVVSSNPTATVEVGKATVTGDRAKVSLKIIAGGTTITTQTVSLVKENGVWKVEMP
jgi:hypothetical protein